MQLSRRIIGITYDLSCFDVCRVPRKVLNTRKLFEQEAVRVPYIGLHVTSDDLHNVSHLFVLHESNMTADLSTYLVQTFQFFLYVRHVCKTSAREPRGETAITASASSVRLWVK